MAISSVARKAIVPEDRSLRDAYQIIGKQMEVEGKLALQREKLRQEQVKQKNEDTAKQFKTLREIDSPYSPYNEDFDRRHEQVQNALLNPGLSVQAKELLLTDLNQYSKQTAVVKAAIIKNTDDRVGSEEQRKFRDAEAISKAQVGYLMDKDGNPMPPNDFDIHKLDEAVDNNLKTYNTQNIIDAWMSKQKATVATEISSKNLASGFSRNDVIQKMGKFLVLNANKDGYEIDSKTGKPLVNITGENLESFEEFSKGNVLAIDDYVAKNKGATRLEAMKAILEKAGHLTATETPKTTLQATPKDTGTAGDRAQELADARSRVDFFDASITEGGQKILSQLKSRGGVVANDTGENKTGVAPIPGGQRFTIVIDPNKVVEVPRTFINASGDEVEFNTLTTKQGKFIVTKVDVMNSDPLTGLIELNALWDKTQPVRFKIDPLDFISEYNKKHSADQVNPFGGAFSGETNPFGVELK